ncbi:metalloregulator ArsR/SmtB family transcription factor [Thiomicrospira sp. WB1]|uniref:ArsR/SmtB family transcription factor n=1 Tax=Thiomicrospira sp. WB1 TaxID=1685380 RepID=UPI0007477DB5|nr:metalloregulator ArsR/SmtB family transcription factor [Thiomicrospira sp. WB1]KUJ73020.1 ArsR family transcriptional regulator [Thiomicrospira sp. WB1]
MPQTSLKTHLFEQLAQVSKALGHANRLMILDVLMQTDCDVETLQNKVGLNLANVSKHLQSLKQAGLVKTQRQGQRMIYSLSDPRVYTLVASLRDVAESQLESMQRLLEDHLKLNTPLAPISLNELAQLPQPYTLLDVRPPDEFAAGHIPSAINVPVESLAQTLPSITPNTTLVVYCRGPYCLWSQEAVQTLQAQGWKAHRLAEGYLEWQSQQDSKPH